MDDYCVLYPFSYEIFRKQWFSDENFYKKIVEWENQSSALKNQSSALENVEGNEYYSNDMIKVLEPLGMMQCLGNVSLVHLMGVSKVWRRFNVVTLRKNDVPWLLEIRDQLKKSAWKKRYYSDKFINTKFLNAYYSWNEKNCLERTVLEKNSLVMFLMGDSFNLCRVSADYLADCLIEGKAPDVDLWFGFRFPFNGENVLYMHCIDRNLLTHFGRMMLRTMVSLDEVVSFLEKYL